MIAIKDELCTGCGACVKECVNWNISVTGGKASVNGECIQCGHCIAICPSGAATISDTAYDIQDMESCSPEAAGLDPQALLHTVKFRRSIRQYKKTPVETEKLNLLLQAGRYTATGANCQKFHFAVVQEDMDTFKEMAWQIFEDAIHALPEDAPEHKSGIIRRAKLYRTDASYDSLFWGAPCLIVIASESQGGLWDAGMASQAMELMAVSQNLGMLYSGYLTSLISRNISLQEWLGISGLSVKTCLLLGYPDVQYKRSAPRKYARIHWR